MKCLLLLLTYQLHTMLHWNDKLWWPALRYLAWAVRKENKRETLSKKGAIQKSIGSFGLSGVSRSWTTRDKYFKALRAINFNLAHTYVVTHAYRKTRLTSALNSRANTISLLFDKFDLDLVHWYLAALAANVHLVNDPINLQGDLIYALVVAQQCWCIPLNHFQRLFVSIMFCLPWFSNILIVLAWKN